MAAKQKLIQDVFMTFTVRLDGYTIFIVIKVNIYFGMGTMKRK